MGQASITHQGGQVLAVAGTITVNNAVELEQQGARLFRDMSGTIEVNLASVTLSGTVGLAVLLAWLRTTHKQGTTLQFTQAPKMLRSVAEVSGLERLFVD